MQSTTESTSLHVLNRMLRGELSAIETYAQAVKKIGNEPGASEIRRIASEHSEAVARLRQQIFSQDGTPTTDSGAWGFWAKTVMTTAKLLGDRLACKALMEGEEHGLKEYEEALKEQDLPPETRILIRAELIPRQHEHIATLDRMMASGGGCCS